MQVNASFGSRIVYCLGAVAYGVKDSGFSTFMMLYFNQVLGLPAIYVGVALLFAILVDAVTDPYVGHLSDGWRSRLGRRHPLMYTAILPAAFAYYIIWHPPSDLSHAALFVWLLVTTILARITITVFEVPNSAMLPELDRSYRGRTSLAGLRQMFGWIGGVVIAVFGFTVFLRPVGDVPGILNREGYEQFVLLAALVMAGTMALSAGGTHRLIPLLPQAGDGKIGPGDDYVRLSFVQTCRRIMAQPLFRALFAGTLCSSLVLGLTMTLQSYFAAFYFEQSAARIGYIALALTPAALAAYPMTNWMVSRWEKRGSALRLIIVSLCLGNIWIIVKLVGLVPDNQHPVVFPMLVMNAFTGTLLLIALQIILVSMMGDLVEVNQRESGLRADGLYMATYSLIRKAVTGFGIFLSGLLLTLGGDDEITPDTMDMVAAPYLALIVILYALSYAFLKRYSMSRADHDANLRALD
ncbi:MAG: MFS transporter [Ahrensia sp.]|nr:MFS transporter [Ahrensia sp.]